MIDWRSVVAAGICTESEAAQLSQHIQLDERQSWTFTEAHRLSQTQWMLLERVICHLCAWYIE